jgi:hypothetical protein
MSDNKLQDVGENHYSYVNPTPPRFVQERDSCFKNPHEADRRGYARAADIAKGRGRATGNTGQSNP